MVGYHLRFVRKSLGLKQADMAKELGCSQKSVSVWEGSQTQLLDEVTLRLHEIAAKRGIELPEISVPEGITAISHSWPPEVFDAICSVAPKMADKVHLRAIISPSTTGSDAACYADMRVSIEFERLHTAGNRLYLDHVRPTPDGVHFPVLTLGGAIEDVNGVQLEKIIEQGNGALGVKSRAANGCVTEMIEVGAVRARIQEDQSLSTQSTLLENASAENISARSVLAYEIYNADRGKPVRVYFKAERAFRLDLMDAIGFPYYTEADFVVGAISIEVEFRDGLVPDPDPPIAKAQLIRRTSFRPNSLSPDFPSPDVIEDGGDGMRRYVFGPLLRPKGGYFYSLAWGGLTRT